MRWTNNRWNLESRKHALTSIGLMLAFWLPLMAIVSCSEPDPTPPPAEDLIASASERMAGLEGFHFAINMSGLPVFLDGDETLALGKAEGFYTKPDQAMGAVSIQAPGLVTNVDVISIGQQQWLTNILSGAWMEMPAEWGFNPAVLFDANDGFLAVLTADLRDPVVVGRDKVDGGPDAELYIIEGTLAGERLAELTLGLLGPDDLDVRLWVHPEDHALYRVIVTNPTGSSEENGSLWQLDFDELGKSVTIEPPL
jgi:hypothetical protein